MVEPSPTALRKWMPPQTRALLTSVSMSLTVAKWRSPRPVRLGMVKSMLFEPRNQAITIPAAGVMHEWALGYSGWLGVPRSGAHAASPMVAALPSVSPARIAVMGRQKANWYLASEHVMSASA